MRTIPLIVINYSFLIIFCSWNIKITLQNNQNNTIQQLDPINHPNRKSTIIIEASWDETDKNQTQVTVQAGESKIFICSIWTLESDDNHDSDSGIHETEQSVFLFCPMSVAYCAQDCLLVESTWLLQCTRQFRIVPNPELLWTSQLKNSKITKGWRLQEVIYKLDIATTASAGFWGCTYGGYRSNSLELIVRDRPALLSLTSSPPNPVKIGTNVKLTCEAAPSPKAPWYTFVWRRIGTQMPPAHSTLRISDTISILTLLSVQPSDDGLYSCHILQSQSNSLNEEVLEDGENVTSGSSNATEKLRFKKDPTVRRLHLEVFHPPTSLNITVKPHEPYRPQTNVTFTCHIHGGKPKPLIYFYRINAPLDNENISLIHSNSFTSKHILENITQTPESTELKWQLTEADNIASFGCAATSPVIKNQMFSLFIRVKIIFSPQDPILSSVPHGPVSENRTKVFTCQSSKGSNPRAKILWELTPAMEYLSAVSKRSYVNFSKSNEKETVMRPTTNSDFEYIMSDIYSDTKHDPNNGGYIAYSEVRLIGRPWFNGARVSCHLIWNEEGNYDVKHVSEATNHKIRYQKIAYLLTEVFFCPSAINLIAIPQNGIQETYGEQILECTATSSHPPAVITWFRHNSSDSVQKTYTENVIIESSLTKIDTKYQPNLKITAETFPGIYGGKRVVSRLKLSNISRISDGMLFTCMVKHIEWTESISRTHQLMVLYPPTLKLKIIPQTMEDRLKSNSITLICNAEGGQPKYFESETDFLDDIQYENKFSKSQGTSLNKDKHNMWKFYWKFRPQYPENWMQSTNQEILFNELNMYRSNKLILNYPGRKQAGDYTCLLEGSTSTAQVTSHLEFTFAPELAPPGITSVTAAVGSHTVIELHIWSYPVPSSIHNPKDTKIKHIVTENCNLHEINSEIPYEIKKQKKTYTWYKVTTERSESGVKILQKELVLENWEPHIRLKQVSSGINKRQLIWTDAILIDFPYYDTDIQIRQNDSESRSTLRKIPTIVYRLFLSPITEKDYGEYMCELEYVEGRKQFFMQVQPPGNPPINVRNMRFTHDDSRIRVYFDPLYFFKTSEGGSTVSEENKNHIIKTKSTLNIVTGNSLSSLPIKSDNSQQLQWKMLIRICASNYYRREQSSEDIIKECSSPQSTMKTLRKPNYRSWLDLYKSFPNNKYQTTSLSNECIDKLVENPEQGRIEIPLIYSFNNTLYNTSHLKSENKSNETVEINNLLSDDTTTDAAQGIYVHWSEKEKLTYQFRFYDESGSLVYATDWVDEENDGYYDESTFSIMGYRNTYLWIVIFGAFFFLLLVILFVFVMRKRLNNKNDFQATNNHSSTPLNKSIINSTTTSPIASCKLQENFYVANLSVVDSPCSLLGRNERVNNRQFPLLYNKDVQKFPNQKYLPIEKHSINQTLMKRNDYHRGEITDENSPATSMPKNLYELRYNQLGLSHNQFSGEALSDELQSISPETNSPIVSHLTPIPIIRSNEMAPSTPLLLYNSCCNNRKFSVGMNHYLPPLFGPIPIQYNSKSTNSVSELSSPFLGHGNHFRKTYRAPANICYHHHLQNGTTINDTRNTIYNKRNNQEDLTNQTICKYKMNQPKLNNTLDIKNDVANTLNCCSPPTEMNLLKVNDKCNTLETDSFGQYNSNHKPKNRSISLMNNLYPLNQTEFQSSQINSDRNNSNCNINNCYNMFNSDNDRYNNSHFISSDINNDLKNYDTNKLGLKIIPKNTYHSESNKLSSPLFEHRPNLFSTEGNHSRRTEGSAIMNTITDNEVSFMPSRHHEELPEMKMSTFNQNYNLTERLSPYDNTVFVSSTIKYNPISINHTNIDCGEMYINNNSLEENNFPLGINNNNDNNIKLCTINSKLEND
uniref:Protein turtle n=1 Tax=Schistosoma mansoni TaxID=6183 RepID=A0A5K4F8Y3_SCHMA